MSLSLILPPLPLLHPSAVWIRTDRSLTSGIASSCFIVKKTKFYHRLFSNVLYQCKFMYLCVSVSVSACMQACNWEYIYEDTRYLRCSLFIIIKYYICISKFQSSSSFSCIFNFILHCCTLRFYAVLRQSMFFPPLLTQSLSSVNVLRTFRISLIRYKTSDYLKSLFLFLIALNVPHTWKSHLRLLNWYAINFSWSNRVWNKFAAKFVIITVINETKANSCGGQTVLGNYKTLSELQVDISVINVQ